MKELKIFWFTFEDGFEVCTRGFSRQEMGVMVAKHGKLIRKTPA